MVESSLFSSSNQSSLSAAPFIGTGGYDHTIRLWDASQASCSQILQHPDSAVNSLAFSYGESAFIVAAGYKHIRLYDFLSGATNPITDFEGHSGNCTCVLFDATGQWLFSSGEDGTLCVWDTRANTCQKALSTGATSGISSFILHPNQMILIAASLDGSIYFWDVRNEENEKLSPLPTAPIVSLSICSEANYLAFGTSTGQAILWDLIFVSKTLELDNEAETNLPDPKLRISAHKRYLLTTQLNSSADILVTTSDDGTAKIWDLKEDGILMHTLSELGNRWVWDAKISKDSQYVITTSSNHQARLYDLKDGCLKREFIGHQKGLTSVALRD